MNNEEFMKLKPGDKVKIVSEKSDVCWAGDDTITFDRYTLKFTNILQNDSHVFLGDQKEITFCTIKGNSEFTEEIFDELCRKLKIEIFHKGGKQ